MNERIKQLVRQAGLEDPNFPLDQWENPELEQFAELIIEEYAQEYQRLVNGHSVVVPKDRAHAEALVRMGMFYLEQAK